ncbi:MAG TPA: histidinol-phosphate transaminase [Cyclobacteriaceae bacterium]|nr:histidinol-phosphate transaminase [Cyclobacteriaceae bacterium]
MSNNFIRKNIQQLVPYSSARDEFKGEATTFMDANENPFPPPYNRYPDPLQKALKRKLCELKGVNSSQIFVGNGSDEAIDLLIRACCEPYQDSILITEPTYGMYAVCAGVNAVSIQQVPLLPGFMLDVNLLIRSVTSQTKIIFLCSPNNPSGNLLEREKVEMVLQNFTGLVVIDEAYIDFANDPGFISYLNRYPNLVILQTLSKAWGLAGLRLGLCFASEEIIQALNKIKYPYNINTLTQQIALEALSDQDQMKLWVNTILLEREKLRESLQKLKIVLNVFPSDTNFLLVKVVNAKTVYQALLKKGIVVRDRSSVKGCVDCLRITVGTPAENELLINALKTI